MKTVPNRYPTFQLQGQTREQSCELWTRRIFSTLQEYTTWTARSTVEEITPHLALLREFQLAVGKAVEQAQAKANELSKQTAADAASHTAALRQRIDNGYETDNERTKRRASKHAGGRRCVARAGYD